MKTKFWQRIICLVLALFAAAALSACNGADGDDGEVLEGGYTATEGLLVYYIFRASYSFTDGEKDEHNYDENKPLKEMKYDEDRTWYDVLVERGVESLRMVLTYCNAAVSEGIKLSDDERELIENYITNLRTTAAINSMTLDDYLTDIYENTYVTESVLRSQYELQFISQKYADILEDRFLESLTDKMINEVVASGDAGDDTSLTRNIGAIILAMDNYESEAEAKSAAESMLEKMRDEGVLTANKFEAYAAENSDSPEVMYPNVAPGDMIDEMNAWIYAAGRVAGDAGVVMSDYGAHILYFMSEGDPVNVANAKIILVETKFDEWYTANKGKYITGITDKLIGGLELDV